MEVLLMFKHSKAKKGSKHQNIFWQNLIYGVTYWLLSSPLPEIIFVAALVLSRNQPNLYFNYTSHIWLPILLLGLVATWAYLVYRLIFGNGSAAHVAALLFSYSIYGFYTQGSEASSLLPAIFATPRRFSILQAFVVVVVTAVLAGLVTYAIRFISSRYTIFKDLQAYKILFSAILILFLVEAVNFVNRYFALH